MLFVILIVYATLTWWKCSSDLWDWRSVLMHIVCFE